MGLIPAESNEEMIERFEPMRKYLEEKIGEDIKVFTATDYAGVIEAMRKKRVDIAADNDITYPKMIKKGLVTEESNRVLCYSSPLPGSTLTYRGDLFDELKGKIRDAILNAHNDIQVTGYGELSKYEPASPDDYQQIRDLVEELGLSRKDILK